MTNPPDRVWITFEANGDVPFVAVHERQRADGASWDRACPSAAPHVVREYRLHRPIDWRTGVPDAETLRRCEGLFALLLPDGSVLRECAPQADGDWWWGGAGAGENFLDPEYLDVRWCPEDEMPEGGA